MKSPTTAMENLPNDLKMEILLHLPMKSLLCLKCVSNSWLSLISEPYFAELHFQRSSQQTHRFPYRVIVTDHQQMRSIDINASLEDDSATINLDFPPNDDVLIIGSCRGFLLLLHTKKAKLVLWNPSTSESKKIPIPLPMSYFEMFGLCYNESTDNYLTVLASLTKPNPLSDNAVLGFLVFSVRTNSWEKLYSNIISCRRISVMGNPGVGSVVNGVIHWLVWFLEATPEHHPRSAMKILGFDYKTKNLRQVPKPDDIGLESSYLRVFGEFLTLCVCNKNSDEIKVWAMKEYGVKSSWSKIMSISLNGDLRNSYKFSPLWLTKDGELVTARGSYSPRGGYSAVILSKWSEKGELIERCPNYQECYMNNSWRAATIYTETLFTLPL